MTISELGSLGEFVSSIAVLVTLLFLGLQVRQSNILARRNELNMGHSQISQLRIAVAEHADLAEIIVRGLPAGSLGPAEQIRFDSILSETAWSTFHVWDRTQLGLYEDDEWTRHLSGIAAILRSPGGSTWWESNKEQFPERFQRAIDDGITDT